MTLAPQDWELAEPTDKPGWILAKWPASPKLQEIGNSWCWAAAAAAIGFERNWTQIELARRLAPYPEDTLNDHPESLKQPRQLGVALDVIGATKRREYHRETEKFTQRFLEAAKDLEGKLAIAIRLGTEEHVVVIHGYHPDGPTVLVWDPAGTRTGTYPVQQVIDNWGWDGWLYTNREDLGKP